MYTLSIKIHKEKEEGIAYLCHVGKWIPKIYRQNTMKQNFFAVDLGATSGRTILGTFIEGGLNLEEINRFPNHLVEVGGHFYWDIYA